jgi:hypothetical protein
MSDLALLIPTLGLPAPDRVSLVTKLPARGSLPLAIRFTAVAAA